MSIWRCALQGCSDVNWGKSFKDNDSKLEVTPNCNAEDGLQENGRDSHFIFCAWHCNFLTKHLIVMRKGKESTKGEKVEVCTPDTLFSTRKEWLYGIPTSFGPQMIIRGSTIIFICHDLFQTTGWSLVHRMPSLRYKKSRLAWPENLETRAKTWLIRDPVKVQVTGVSKRFPLRAAFSPSLANHLPTLKSLSPPRCICSVTATINISSVAP